MEWVVMAVGGGAVGVEGVRDGMREGRAFVSLCSLSPNRSSCPAETKNVRTREREQLDERYNRHTRRQIAPATC